MAHLSFISVSSLSLSAPKLNSGDSSNLPPLFFDAESASLDKEGIKQIYEGNVVAMIAGTLLCADRLSLDRKLDQFEAKGHILVVQDKQVFGGDELIYHIKSQDFFLKNAFLVTQDPKRSDEIAHKILGVSADEIVFEAERARQLQVLTSKKEALKKNYKIVAPSQKNMVINDYALILEKEQLITQQENNVLAQLSQETRDTLLRRRNFWEASKKSNLSIGQPITAGGYTHLQGDWIERTELNHYRASNAKLTPCRCEDDETPAWQIHSDSLDAYTEGYADLQDAIVEVKGIPVLYFPFLRMPVKGKRQSGFLFPNLSYTRFNGSIFSQPIFFDLGANKDSTLTIDMMEKRGIRLGNEFRYQQKTYSGWEFQAEAIRDRQWLTQQAQRQENSRAYIDSLTQAVDKSANTSPTPVRYSQFNAPSLSDPAWWKANGLEACLDKKNEKECQALLGANISSPENTWRHKMEWKGMSFLTPRLSVVSEGKTASDHRYMQDLYFDRFNESYNPAYPELFSKIKTQVNLDGNDFYTGLGMSWGDQMTTDSRYSGHQVPAYLKFKTRSLTLIENPRPVYADFTLNYKRISFFEDVSAAKSLPNDTINVTLDSGNWMQSKFNFLVPLVSQQVFQLNYFTELEARVIETDYNAAKSNIPQIRVDESFSHTNTIQTSRLGLDLILPIDGKMQTSPANSDKTEGLNFLSHKMTWGVTYSLRPAVVKRGNYGEVVNVYKFDPTSSVFQPQSNSQFLTYFDSENPKYFDSDLLPEQDRLIPHQQVIFSTNHDWLKYKKTWQTLSPLTFDEQIAQDFQKRAKIELEYAQSLAEALRTTSSDAKGKNEQDNFQIVESDQNTFLHVDGNISYDFRKEEEKKRLKKENALPQDLPAPWSPFRMNTSVNIADWTLSTFSKYDLYSRLVTELRFLFSPPTVLATKLTLGYSIENEVSYDTDGGYLVNRTLTKSSDLTTKLIPYINLTGAYAIRTKQNQDPGKQYYAAAGAQYLSPSDCWGMQFYWKRDYTDINWVGSYYLSVIIKLFNYNREYGNFLSKVNNLNQNG